MKKLIALCLTLMLVLVAVPVIGAAAANSGKFVVSAPEEAAAGETFDVAINIAENPGIVSAKVLVAYDSNVLEFVSKKDGVFAGIAYGPDTANPFIANWVDAIHPNNTTNGALVTLTFKVKDGAQFGQTPITLSFDPYDVYDLGFNNVDFTTVDGAVTIVCKHKNTTTTPAKASTCTEAGNAEYVTCNDCGAIISGSDEPLPRADHTPEVRGAKAHTATEDGYTGDTYCSVCGELIEKGKVIPAGHVTHKVEAKEATCTAEGNIEYWTCERCDVLFADEEATEEIAAEDVVVAKKAHTLSDVAAKAPTATENGNKAYKKCDVCEKMFDAEGNELTAADIVVPATGKGSGSSASAGTGTGTGGAATVDTGSKSPSTNGVNNILMLIALLSVVGIAGLVTLKKRA